MNRRNPFNKDVNSDIDYLVELDESRGDYRYKEVASNTITSWHTIRNLTPDMLKAFRAWKPYYLQGYKSIRVHSLEEQ